MTHAAMVVSLGPLYYAHLGRQVGSSPGAREREHRDRMVGEANEYALVFPRLEWIYCGHWPMDIQNTQLPTGTARVAVLWAKRETLDSISTICFSWTSKMSEQVQAGAGTGSVAERIAWGGLDA